MADERIKPSWLDHPLWQNDPSRTGSQSASEADWHVIQSGKELGPFSLAELVEKAIAEEFGADDLIKQTGGLWTKARDSDFLEQFLNKDRKRSANQAAHNKPERFQGIWLSKKMLVIGGCVMLFLVGFSAMSAIGKPTYPPSTLSKENSLPAITGNEITDEEKDLIQFARKVKAAPLARPLTDIGNSFSVVSETSPDVRDVISDEEIKTRVELRLRQFGFTIKANSPNLLIVNVNGVWQNRSQKTTMGTNISLDVKNWACASRTNGRYAQLDTTVWRDAYVGVAGNLVVTNHIEGGIDRAIDRLINEHLAANGR